MKNKKILGILFVLGYVGIIFISYMYIIKPGLNKLNEASRIKELSYDEKTKLIDDINKKYIDLENKVNDKYTPDIDGINKKYDDLKVNIEDTYKKLESDIENKYTNEEKKLNDQINDNKVLQNKEFFANGLSKKYYELSNKGTELFKEKSTLELKKVEEIRENNKKKDEELDKNEMDRNSELKTISDNKTNELARLKDKKTLEIDDINNRKTNKNKLKFQGLTKIILGIIIIVIPIIYVIIVFNKLTILLNNVKEKWSRVDIYLKERTDLIPNIVNIVKGYSTHEKDTLKEITKARNQVIKATTKEEEIIANERLENEVGRIFMLKEDYPELKSNENFMNLQENLIEIEDNISLSREEYNSAVLKYKNKLETFPSNIVANLFNFKSEMFFEINSDEKKNVEISFE